MGTNRDLILANIRKQLSTQSGQLQITNQGGNWQWANGKGTPVNGTNDMTNYGLSRAPGNFISSMAVSTYELAKGLFGGPGVPDSLIEVLANMATYYATTTGQPVQNLFRQGVMLNEFLATVNSIRDPSSQIGYVGINITPGWVKNPTLGPTITAALNGT